MKGFFITGTDTGIGKTYIACKLLQSLNNLGFKTAALKPIASGCDKTEHGLVNDDALQLQKCASEKQAYKEVNPFAFEPSIAPHIAANQINQPLSVEKLMSSSQAALSSHADYLIVEGAGGWLVPLNKKETMADYAKSLNVPIILVAGVRLGWLNHTMLTVENILNKGIRLAGWVANCCDPNMLARQENINFLIENIPAPHLGTVAWKQPCDLQLLRVLNCDPLILDKL